MKGNLIMEEDKIINYLYRRLKNNHLWFVTKNDINNNTWLVKPKKYYELDEYGELKNKTKVVKEINDYIGDGANTLFEAVSLFIEDGITDGSILTTDYLNMEFKDKPVDYIETAVEVKNTEPKYIEPQITGSNKQVESKLLKEKEYDLSKDILGDESNKRMSEDQRAYEKYLQFARDIKDGKNNTITLDSAKQLLKNAYIKAKGYYSLEPEEIDKRLARDLPEIFNDSKTENVQRRLNEENNKSQNIISNMFQSKDFDADSKSGQIVMRTSNLFNTLSDKGYDVQVAFDNGESTNTILLGQQGGQLKITINDTNTPLRAFTDGSFELTEDNIKILDDISKEIKTL